MNTNTDNETPDYGEPWACEPDGNGISIYARNDTVYSIQESFAWDEIYARRAVACVNACFGMADPSAELAAMREAIKEAHAALKDACAYPVCGCWNEQAEVAITKLQPFIK